MKQKWIVDTDSGIDDTHALFFLFAHPEEIEIKAITLVAGNVSLPIAEKAILKTLEICKAQIPVYLGAEEGILNKNAPVYEIHGKDGQGEIEEFKDLQGDVKCINRDEPAALALSRIARENKGEINLLALGPLTNIALALKLDPELAGMFRRVVIMGGSHHAIGNVTSCAEYNFYSDPEAAHICLTAFPAIELLTKENGDLFNFSSEEIASLCNSSSLKGRFLKGMLEYFIKASGGELLTFDIFAAAVALDPSLVSKSILTNCKVELHGALTRGTLLIDWKHKSPNGKITIILSLDRPRTIKLLQHSI